MKLSESEVQFVRKWQRQRRSWRWVCWFSLISSIILILLAAWGLRRLLDLVDDQNGGAAAIGWLAPFAWFTLLAPSGWLGYTLGHWRGDVRTQLLLRLIEDHEKEDA